MTTHFAVFCPDWFLGVGMWGIGASQSTLNVYFGSDHWILVLPYWKLPLIALAVVASLGAALRKRIGQPCAPASSV
jgi:hypothetical protein